MAVTPIEVDFAQVMVGNASVFRRTINDNFELAKTKFINDVNNNLDDIQSQISYVSTGIRNLEIKVGDSSVSDQINNKINTLDVGETTLGAGKIVNKWSETNGKINITTRDINISESGGDIACVGTYNKSTNKLMTNSAVTTAITNGTSTIRNDITNLQNNVATLEGHASQIRSGGETSNTWANIWVS